MKILGFIGLAIVAAVVALQIAAIILPIVGIGFLLWMAYELIKEDCKKGR